MAFEVRITERRRTSGESNSFWLVSFYFIRFVSFEEFITLNRIDLQTIQTMLRCFTIGFFATFNAIENRKIEKKENSRLLSGNNCVYNPVFSISYFLVALIRLNFNTS